MGGIFSKSSRPTRPGAYFNWQAVQPVSVPPAIGSVVALGFTHTWGPDGVAVECDSFGDWLDVFGGDITSPSSGMIAAKQAFQGEGSDAAGGAGSMIAYRLCGSSGAKASHAFTNTTPATALTLTARYKGSYGNRLNVTVQTNAADGTKKDVLIYDNTTLLETWTWLATDITGLAAAINAGSSWVTAVANVTGTALTAVTNVSLTAGDDGSTLVSGDYTTAEAVLGTQRFGILVFENLTDSSILASLKTWSDGLNVSGRRFTTIVGGALDENSTTAIARSGTLNDSDFINFGVGHVTDSTTLDVNGLPVVLSTAQAAPRIAGVLAARGERLSMTFAHIEGWTLYNGATDSQIAQCIAGGVVVLSLDSNPTAPVRIESSRTTYTTTTNSSKPYTVYRNPKAVAIMHGVEMELTEWAESTVVGQPVDGETRASVLAKINTVMQRRVDQRIIQSGFSAIIDPNPPASDDDEFVAFQIGFKYGRSAEQVFFTGQIG